MLHILWMIFKIILIILAVVLGLVLLALLIILFCPLCYRAKAVKNESGIRGMAKVHWLFHAVSALVLYEDGETKITVKLLGIRLERLQSFFSRFQKRKRPKETENIEEEIETEENAPAETASIEQEQIENTVVEDVLDTDEGAGIFQQFFSGAAGVWRKITGVIVRGFRAFIKTVLFIFHLPGKILSFFRKISLTFNGICDKISMWKDLLDEDTSREALSLVWGKGIRLLRHISPRKLEGNITFGLENPAATGQVLAVIGATCPIHRNVITITPVFDKVILEGEIFMRGRIYFAAMAKLAIEVYFNKNVKSFIKSIKQMEG